MGKITRRLLEIRLPRRRSAFLWGPRGVGKSTWIRQHHPDAPLIDLLQTDVFAEYAARPALLRERFAHRSAGVIVIDEVQKAAGWAESVKRLWDEDSRSKRGLKVVLLGSAPLLIQRGLSESLAGRFEILHGKTALVRVMAWGNLEGTGTELHTHIFVCDDGNFAL